MAKTAQQFEQEFLATIKAVTGKTLDQWMSAVARSGITKQPEIIKWMKIEFGLNHMQANMITSIYKNDGKPVYDYSGFN